MYFFWCSIYNLLAMTCWAGLAVFFDRWWVALFSILFVAWPVKAHKYYRICDKCGKYSTYTDSRDAAIKRAEKEGWLHVQESNSDYCPDCRKTFN